MSVCQGRRTLTGRLGLVCQGRRTLTGRLGLVYECMPREMNSDG